MAGNFNIGLSSFRGGINEDDFPANLADDQVEEAANVEMFLCTCGERRLGTMPFESVSSALQAEASIVMLGEYYPTNTVRAPEHWMVGATPGTSVTVVKELAGTSTTVVPDDAITNTSPGIYGLSTQPLGGKLFFSYPSGQDRLHVWDGTYLRRTGLSAPASAPPVTNTAVAGTYSGTRYARYRFAQLDGSGNILRLSEPSATTTFTPDGTHTGMIVTRDAAASEHENYWIVELSSDGAFFFQVSTVLFATTTYTDTTNLATTSYSLQGPASPEIGTYDLQQSARYLIADADRLILAGHWSDNTYKSRVWWTPVNADPGYGNDERIPLSTGGDNFVDLDNYDGAEVTGLSSVINGVFYAFKWGAIYRFVRTGDLTHAYDVTCVTKSRGALPGSIAAGLDEMGRPCVYFWDPSIGPCSIGGAGLRDILGMRTTRARLTITDSTKVAIRAGFYATKKQLHWLLAVDGNLVPNLGLCLQTNYMRPAGNGSVQGSWTRYTGLRAQGIALYPWHETTVEGGIERLRERLFLGMVKNASAPIITGAQMVQRTDCLDTDNSISYTAQIISRPLLPAGIHNQWGVISAAVLALSSTTASFKLKLVRNMGAQSSDFVTVSLVAPEVGEVYTSPWIDNLFLSEARILQLVVQDV